MLYPLSYWGICHRIVQCFAPLVKRARPITGGSHMTAACQLPPAFLMQRKACFQPELFGPGALAQKRLRLLI